MAELDVLVEIVDETSGTLEPLDRTTLVVVVVVVVVVGIVETGARGTNGLKIVVVVTRGIVVKVDGVLVVLDEVEVAPTGRRAMVVEVVVRRGTVVVTPELMAIVDEVVIGKLVVLVVAVGTEVDVVEVVVMVVEVVGAPPPSPPPPPPPPPPDGTVVVVGVGTLLVTLVAAMVATSLPFASCTAFASLLPEGSVYATVTDAPADTADASVNTTVEPDTATLETVRDTPSTTTAKAEDEAVVADNASEYVSVTVKPSVLVEAEANVGARVSTVDAFVTDVAEILATSLPTESCTALASLPAVGSVYVNVTVSPL